MYFRSLYNLGHLHLREKLDLGGWMAVGLYFALGVPFMLYAKHMQKKKPDEWKQIILSPDQVREEE